MPVFFNLDTVICAQIQTRLDDNAVEKFPDFVGIGRSVAQRFQR
jgi:hypothetical protein